MARCRRSDTWCDLGVVDAVDALVDSGVGLISCYMRALQGSIRPVALMLRQGSGNVGFFWSGPACDDMGSPSDDHFPAYNRSETAGASRHRGR